MSFDQLPYNVILQILWYISQNKLDFGHLRSTCKRLAEITRDQRFTHLVTCGKCDKNDVNSCMSVETCKESWRENIINVHRLSCILLSQKNNTMTEILLHYVNSCITIDIGILKFFVENGADIDCDPNICCESGCIVTKAAEQGRIDVVKFLISWGANFHAGNDKIILYASRSGNLKLLKYLIKQGVNIHVYNNEAILCAAKSGNLEMVKFFVSNGLDIHQSMTT